MLTKLLQLITRKDDLERIAYREDIRQLNAYLRTRRVWIPRRPKSFLDAASVTQEQLLELIEEEAEALAGDTFEPWILDVDGKKRLPAFSSQKKMKPFSIKVSQQINMVFSLGCAELLLEEITKNVDVDFVDLNPFSRKSWEIAIRSRHGES